MRPSLGGGTRPGYQQQYPGQQPLQPRDPCLPLTGYTGYNGYTGYIKNGYNNGYSGYNNGYSGYNNGYNGYNSGYNNGYSGYRPVAVPQIHYGLRFRSGGLTSSSAEDDISRHHEPAEQATSVEEVTETSRQHSPEQLTGGVSHFI